MWVLLTALASFGFLALAWLQLRPYLDRWFALVEQPKSSTHKPSEPMPADILSYVYSFEAEWAREQVEDRAYELFAKLGSWGNVRRALTMENQQLSVMDVETPQVH